MKLSNAFFALAIFAAAQPSWSSHHSAKDQEDFVQDVCKQRSTHPVTPLDGDENHMHMRGFPTFVEITEKGSAVMMKQGTANISFFARFEGLDEPIRLYNLNHYFFCRAKEPGLYQPDYPVLALRERFYYPGLRFMERDDIKQRGETLKKYLHGINIINGPQYTTVMQYFPECDLERTDDLKKAVGELTHLGGNLWFGDVAPVIPPKNKCV